MVGTLQKTVVVMMGRGLKYEDEGDGDDEVKTKRLLMLLPPPTSHPWRYMRAEMGEHEGMEGQGHCRDEAEAAAPARACILENRRG